MVTLVVIHRALTSRTPPSRSGARRRFATKNAWEDLWYGKDGRDWLEQNPVDYPALEDSLIETRTISYWRRRRALVRNRHVSQLSERKCTSC